MTIAPAIPTCMAPQRTRPAAAGKSAAAGAGSFVEQIDQARGFRRQTDKDDRPSDKRAATAAAQQAQTPAPAPVLPFRFVLPPMVANGQMAEPGQPAGKTPEAPQSLSGAMPDPAPEGAAAVPVPLPAATQDMFPKGPGAAQGGADDPGSGKPPVVTADSEPVPTPQTGAMAFAARIKPANGTGQPTPKPSPSSVQATRSPAADAHKEEDTHKEEDAALPALANNQAPAAATVVTGFAGRQPAPATHLQPATETAHRAAAEPAIPETRAGATPALKDISLQVSQAGENNVRVRLVQTGGELYVAVRTGDAVLAHGLQQGLPELVGRLQENGFKAETWRPAGSIAPAPAASESQSTSHHAGSGDSQYPSGSPQQQGGQQRNPNQDQSGRPRWVEHLESSLGGSPEISGESHGNVS